MSTSQSFFVNSSPDRLEESETISKIARQDPNNTNKEEIMTNQKSVKKFTKAASKQAKRPSSAMQACSMINTEEFTKKDQAIIKKISASSIKFGEYDNVQDLLTDAKIYTSAVRQGRAVCIVHSVASSGMSRKVSLRVMQKSSYGNSFSFLNFNSFAHLVTGDRLDKDHQLIITGCGFDVVWDLNYRICNTLCSLGFINQKDCAELAQNRPHVG